MSGLAADTLARRDALAAVYRKVPRSVWFTLLVVWASAYLLAGHAPLPGILAWATFMTVVGLARFGQCLWSVRRPGFLDDVYRDTRQLTLGVLVHGIGFAAGFLLLGAGAPLAVQCAFSLFVVGLSAGAATVFTGCRAAFVAYTEPVIVTLTLTLLWIGFAEADSERAFLGLMLLVYAVAIWVFQGNLDRSLLENMRLHHEHAAALAACDERLAELTAHNEALSADRDAFLTASLTDGLTGLANRRHFDRTLARDWERNRRDGLPLACILMDIDHFKNYNDRYGHMAGDDCLRSIAGIIDATVSRGGDFAARYGGEEFVVLLPGTDATGARLIAERIRVAVQASAIPHAGGGPKRVVTLSAGVAAAIPGTHHPTSQVLLDMADEALYRAKEAGRNRVRVQDLEARRDAADGPGEGGG